MLNKTFLRVLPLITALLATTFPAAFAAERVELTVKGEQLLARYAAELSTLRAEIEKAIPAIDEDREAAFMEAYRAVGKARGDAWRDVKKYAETFEPVAEAQAEALEIARPILADLTPFLASDRLDAKLIKIAILANATPRGLAEFAQQGDNEQALIDKLLADTALMAEMCRAGGARLGLYGKAMQIYTGIMQASEKAQEPGILRRLAIGSSVELCGPVEMRGGEQVDAVDRYIHFEKAYLNGELDPKFPTLTAWECRFVVNSKAQNEELAWGREMLRNYRPDHIFEPDYRWRYVKVVKTDVKYKRSDPALEDKTFFQNIMHGGGVCGRRAFFGRFILRAFGIPTFGMRQRGHAAVGHWTPDGWTTNFGAHWRWNWWDRPGHERSGEDFLLETQARRHRDDFVKVLRAEWVGDALGEAKRDRRKPGTGDLWNALALYQARAIVAEAKPVEVALAGEDLAEANESTKAEEIMKTDIPDANRQIRIADNGLIVIPATACSQPTNSTKKITFMKSFLGGMQLHYNRLGKPEAFEYTLEVPKAGTYQLTGRVVTVRKGEHLMLTPNGAEAPVKLALPYTVGMWQETEPIEVALAEGRNVLSFTREEPNYGVTIKEFVLKPVK